MIPGVVHDWASAPCSGCGALTRLRLVLPHAETEIPLCKACRENHAIEHPTGCEDCREPARLCANCALGLCPECLFSGEDTKPGW